VTNDRSTVCVGGTQASTPRQPSQAVVPAQVLQRQIDEDFQLPGLISIPTRVSVPKGKGYAFLTARYKAVSDEDVITIPPDVVRETVTELERPRPDDSARDQLLTFVVLYKYILDTTVKRTVAERQKKLFDLTYMQLTPQAAMGLTIKFMYGTKMEVATNPVFGNSRDTRINTTLGLILMTTHKRDPFFLWLLFLFSSGAVAPTTRKDGEAEAVEQATTARRRGSGRKRNRGSPKSKDPAGGNEPPVSGWRNEGGGRAAVGGRLEETNVQGSHASVGRSGSGDNAAKGGSGESEARVGGAVDLVEHALARFLWSGGQVVRTADLHPEWTLFHSSPAPTGVVAGFLTSVSEGCGDMPYPFGQDEKLCLEKGYPSATPVPLRSVGSSKIAWPAGAIGYVAWPHSSVQVWECFCAL